MIQNLWNKIKQNVALKDLVLNSLWSIVGTFISKVLLFLIWIFVAKLLKANGYGEFSIIRSTTMLFADFVGSSIGLAGTNYIAKYYQNDIKKVERLVGLFNVFSFVFGFFFFILSWTFSESISINMLHKSELAIYLQASSVVILIASINNNQYGILRGFNQYKTISKINLLQIIFSFPVYYIGTYFFSLEGAVFAYIFYNLIVCVFARIELRKLFDRLKIKPSYKDCVVEGKTVLVFILPYIISGFIIAFLSWYNETKLVAITECYSQMGHNTIIKVMALIRICVSFMVFIPFVSMMSKYQNSDSFILLEKLNIFLPLQVALLIEVPLMLFPEIVAWLYGSSYTIENIRQISNYMFFFVFWAVYRQAVARFVAVKERTWLYLADSVTFALLAVILFAYFYKHGVVGFVWGQTIAYITVVVLFLPLYLKFHILPVYVMKDSYLKVLFGIPILIFLFSFLEISILTRVVLCLIILGGNLYWFWRRYLISIK